MDIKLTTITISLAAIIAVWVVTAIILWTDSKSNPSCYQEKRSNGKIFFINAEVKYGMTAFLFVTAVLVIIIFIPEDKIQPYGSLIALLIGIFLGGISSTLWFLLLVGKYTIDDKGLCGRSAWGLPRHVAWKDVKRVEYGAGSYKFIGSGKPVYVSMQIDYHQAFLAQVKKHTSSISKDLLTGKSVEQLMEDKHLEGLEKHAIKFALGMAVIFLATISVVIPYYWTILSTTIAGMLMGLSLRLTNKLRRKRRRFLAGISYIFGFVAFILTPQIATREHIAYLGGEDNLSGIVIFAVTIQILSATILAMFITLSLQKTLSKD